MQNGMTPTSTGPPPVDVGNRFLRTMQAPVDLAISYDQGKIFVTFRQAGATFTLVQAPDQVEHMLAAIRDAVTKLVELPGLVVPRPSGLIVPGQT
jgi:hypothetical protein